MQYVTSHYLPRVAIKERKKFLQCIKMSNSETDLVYNLAQVTIIDINTETGITLCSHC